MGLLDVALNRVLARAAPQSFPGVLTMTCEGCPLGEVTMVDRELTGADLVAIIDWGNLHSGHGARAIKLELPPGTDTRVGPGL